MSILDGLLKLLGLKSEFPRPEDDVVPMSQEPVESPVPEGNVRYSDPIQIEYTNYQGLHRTFAANRKSLNLKGAHVSVEVEPTGMRIALKRDKITNGDVVVAPLTEAMENGPDHNEARTLRFHQKRGTTSPLYESLVQKYPDF